MGWVDADVFVEGLQMVVELFFVALYASYVFWNALFYEFPKTFCNAPVQSKAWLKTYILNFRNLQIPRPCLVCIDIVYFIYK